MKRQMTIRFDEETYKKMDMLIIKKKFDDRPSLIRRAVNDFLENDSKPIQA